MTQHGYVPVDEVKRWLKRELHSVKDEHVNKVLLTSTEDDGERSFTTTVDQLGMKWVKANRGHTIHHVCVQAEHNKMHQTEMVPPPPSYPPRPDHPPPPRLPPPPDEPQVVCRSVPGHQASLSDAPEERYAPIRHRHEEDGRTTVSAAKPKGPPSHHRQSGSVQEFYTSPREDHEASRTMSWKASTESSGSSKSRLTAVGTPGTALGDFQGAEYQNYDSNDNYLSFRSGDRLDLIVAVGVADGWAYGRSGDKEGWFPEEYWTAASIDSFLTDDVPESFTSRGSTANQPSTFQPVTAIQLPEDDGEIIRQHVKLARLEAEVEVSTLRVELAEERRSGAEAKAEIRELRKEIFEHRRFSAVLAEERQSGAAAKKELQQLREELNESRRLLEAASRHVQEGCAEGRWPQVPPPPQWL